VFYALSNFSLASHKVLTSSQTTPSEPHPSLEAVMNSIRNGLGMRKSEILK
jgi:hypothetical protein